LSPSPAPPSGAERAPAVAPTSPLPSGRFSTITGCFSRAASSWLTTRGMMSPTVPGAETVMKRIGRVG